MHSLSHVHFSYFLFQKFPTGMIRSYNAARKAENAKKNRYKGIYACKLSFMLTHNFNDSNADGSFTVVDKNSFLKS